MSIPTHLALPEDVICYIVDLSDRQTLLALAETTQFINEQSRSRFFQTLSFHASDYYSFVQFICLIGSECTTLPASVKNLRISGLFSPHQGAYDELDAKNGRQLGAKMSRLATLQLKSLDWSFIPEFFCDFLRVLPITNLQLDSLTFSDRRQIASFWNGRPDTVTAISLYDESLIASSFEEGDLRGKKSRNHASGSSRFDISSRGVVRSARIDNLSLLPFRILWDPDGASDSTIPVESFHLHFTARAGLWETQRRFLPYISRFLQYHGPDLTDMSIDVSDPWFEPLAIPLYIEVNFSNCTNLRALAFGIVAMNLPRGPETCLEAMWKIMRAIPTGSIERVTLIFDAYQVLSGFLVAEETEKTIARINDFLWIGLFTELVAVFPFLKHVKIKIGAFIADKIAMQIGLDGLQQRLTMDGAPPILVDFEALSWTPTYTRRRFSWMEFRP